MNVSLTSYYLLKKEENIRQKYLLKVFRNIRLFGKTQAHKIITFYAPTLTDHEHMVFAWSVCKKLPFAIMFEWLVIELSYVMCIPCGNKNFSLVPRSMSYPDVKVKYQGHIFSKSGHYGGISVPQTQFVPCCKRWNSILQEAGKLFN